MEDQDALIVNLIWVLFATKRSKSSFIHFYPITVVANTALDGIVPTTVAETQPTYILVGVIIVCKVAHVLFLRDISLKQGLSKHQEVGFTPS